MGKPTRSKIWDHLEKIEAELQTFEKVLNQSKAMKVRLTRNFSMIETTTLEETANNHKEEVSRLKNNVLTQIKAKTIAVF